MQLPDFAYISVHATVDLEDLLNQEDKEYLERNNLKGEDLKDKLKEWIKDNLWDYVPENKISIEFD